MDISVVIPLAPWRNPEILKSLEKQDYDKKKFEIVVEKGRNPSRNRNRGAGKSRGDIIVFADDDAFVEKDYLKKVKKFFYKHPDIDIAGGPQLSPKDERGFAKISGYALSSLFSSWKTCFRYRKGKTNFNADESYITSANLACRKNVLRKVKFDPDLFPGEDPDFIQKSREAGFRVAYTPEVYIYHRRRSSPVKLIKQIFSYGKTRTERNIIETLKRPFFLVPALFLIYLFAFFLSWILSSFNFLFFIPILVYININILFSLYESVKNRDFRSFFVLPFIYLAIHLSYGAGILYGFLKIKFKR
jgi:GT2 family glycosyltransferase